MNKDESRRRPGRRVSTYDLVVGSVGLLFFEGVYLALTFGGTFSLSTFEKVGSLVCFAAGIYAGMVFRHAFAGHKRPDHGKRRQIMGLLISAGAGVGVLIGSLISDEVAPGVMVPLVQVLFGFVSPLLAYGWQLKLRGTPESREAP